MENNTKVKSYTQTVAEFMLAEGIYFTTVDLGKRLNIGTKQANNAYYSIKKSGRYDVTEKRIGESNAMKVLVIKPSNRTGKRGWEYTRQERQERIKWDFAIFGVEPSRNKAFEV